MAATLIRHKYDIECALGVLSANCCT